MRESAIITCPRHPKVETYIRCASCNTPICPKCYVQTPVGYKCKACGTFKNAALFSVSPLQALAGFAVGLLAGVVAGYFFTFIGFFAIWVAFPYGRFTGMLIQRASGHKLGLLMEVITGGSILLGGLGLRAWTWLQYYQQMRLVQTAAKVTALHTHLPTQAPLNSLSMLVLLNPFALIGVVVVAVAAVSRFRFMWNMWGF